MNGSVRLDDLGPDEADSNTGRVVTVFEISPPIVAPLPARGRVADGRPYEEDEERFSKRER